MKVVSIFLFVLFVSGSALAQSKVPTRFEEFVSISCEAYLASMDNAMNVARNDPQAKIYVFVYEGKYTRWVPDGRGDGRTMTFNPEIGMAKSRIRSMEERVRRWADLSQFVFVAAGYRKEATVAMWLVPVGAEPPSPSPTLKKITFRKRKPSGFCRDSGS